MAIIDFLLHKKLIFWEVSFGTWRSSWYEYCGDWANTGKERNIRMGGNPQEMPEREKHIAMKFSGELDATAASLNSKMPTVRCQRNLEDGAKSGRRENRDMQDWVRTNFGVMFCLKDLAIFGGARILAQGSVEQNVEMEMCRDEQ